MPGATTKQLKDSVEKQNKYVLSQSIMKENNWYLVPETATQNPPIRSWKHVRRLSVIVHDCQAWKLPKDAKRKIDFMHLRYWDHMEVMETDCVLCGELPPENLVTCWVLMNTEFIGTG